MTAARVTVALLALLGLLFVGPIVYWHGTYVGLYLACRRAEGSTVVAAEPSKLDDLDASVPPELLTTSADFNCADRAATRLLTVPGD